MNENASKPDLHRRSFTRAGAFALPVLLLFSSVAAADAISLRAPGANRRVSVELGYPESSVGVWFNNWLGVGVFARVPLSSVGVQLGLRRTFLGEPNTGWALDGVASLGVEFTTGTVSFVADATGALGVRYFGPWFIWQLYAVAPLKFRLTDELQAKFPVLAELWLGGRAGGLWIALHGAAGASFLAGFQPTPAIQLGVAITLEF